MTGQWFSLGTLVSFTNKTDHHDITETLLTVVLNTIIPTLWSYGIGYHLGYSTLLSCLLTLSYLQMLYFQIYWENEVRFKWLRNECSKAWYFCMKNIYLSGTINVNPIKIRCLLYIFFIWQYTIFLTISCLE